LHQIKTLGKTGDTIDRNFIGLDSIYMLKLTIMNAVGLHARPAALFVQTAQKFTSEITVKKGNLQANGKSLLSILALSIAQGSEITIHAKGADSEKALISLGNLVRSNFGEDS